MATRKNGRPSGRKPTAAKPTEQADSSGARAPRRRAVSPSSGAARRGRKTPPSPPEPAPAPAEVASPKRKAPPGRSKTSTAEPPRPAAGSTARGAKPGRAQGGRGRPQTAAQPPATPARQPAKRQASEAGREPARNRAAAGARPRRAAPTEEGRIASAKYSLGPAAAGEAGPAGAPGEAAPFREEAFTFPETYGQNRLRLLMQSPGRLFAHWDVSPAAVDEVRRELGRRATALARLALRITAAGASRPLVVLLPRGARSWYVDVPGQRHEYRADLGLMLPSGEFRVLASSNVLRMPRTSPSPRSAGARVAFDRTRPAARAPVSELPPETPPAGEAFAAEVGTAEPSGSGEASAPGGSSELSARSGPRRAERVPPPGAVEADLGGASELFPRGSSSDLRRRR